MTAVPARGESHRRAHRCRRERSRRFHGSRGAARRGAPRRAREPRVNVMDCGNVSGPPNPGLPGRRATAISARWRRGTARCTAPCIGSSRRERCRSCWAAITASRIGSISAVARRCREAAAAVARAVARRACRFQYARAEPQRKPARHAGRLLVRLRSAGAQQIGGASPAIEPQWVRQVGIRSVDPGERRFMHDQELAVFDMRYIDEMGVRRAMELALEDSGRTRTCT